MKHLIIASILMVSGISHADVIVEESGSKAIFKVNGKTVSPVEAQAAAANSKNEITRCSPIKDAVTTDGNPAYRCKSVVLVINPKTGTTKWKNL